MTDCFVPVLTVAGSDSGGNAGAQADCRAFRAFGLHACTAISSLTAQNPRGVAAVHVPPADFLAAQLDAIFEAVSPRAAKTGMLATAECVRLVASRLRARRREMPAVVDPVMVATSGAPLLEPDAIRAVASDLLSAAALATQNVPEAETLSGMRIRGVDGMAAAARQLRRDAGCAVLVKGGHLAGADASRDVLVCNEGEFLLESPAVPSPASVHGTGCTLSAAIAASLALGRSLPDAVREGKAFVYEAILRSRPVPHASSVLGVPEVSGLLSHPAVSMRPLAV